MLISKATGGEEDNAEYIRLRGVALSHPFLEPLTPRFLRSSRTTNQFWQFIQPKFKSYAERRTFLRAAFNPILELLERGGTTPSDQLVSGAIKKFDAENVSAAWSKALERRSFDPDGAITSARTLLESVCKHILEEALGQYEETPDITKLYAQTARQLNIAPSQHTEVVFKQILGGCTAVVEGLGALRNRLSDSHGIGKVGARPSPRHAELAVNLAGALATFLLATWDARRETST